MLAALKPLLHNVVGVTVIEYAAIAAIISIAAVAAMTTIGSSLSNTFGNVVLNF